MDKGQKPADAVLPVSDAMREALVNDIVWQISNVHDLRDYAVRTPIESAVRRSVEAALSVQEPTPSPGVVVDEAMVERACLHKYRDFVNWADVDKEWGRNIMRDLLAAALTKPSQNAGGEQPTPKAVCPSCDGTGADLWDGTEHDCQVCNGRKFDAAPAPNVVSGAVRDALESGMRSVPAAEFDALYKEADGLARLCDYDIRLSFMIAKHKFDEAAAGKKAVDVVLFQAPSPSARGES